MFAELTTRMIRTIQDAAKRLTGAARRKFEAQVAVDYCQGSPRKAETIFGWGRVTVQTGLDELQTGIPRNHRHSDRGRRKAEDKLPQLEEDIRRLLEPQSQIDPKFQSTFLFTRATGQAVWEALRLNRDVYSPEDLPSVRTMRRVMNRSGFRLRRVQKAKPAKKIPETDALFEHVGRAHLRSDQEDDCLRISMDAKAKVKLGEFSRGGKSRGSQPKKACDHDMGPEALLVPFGILETEIAQFMVVFGRSRETSDFIVDCLQLWWDERKAVYSHIRKLQIDLDNGPELASNRTQFIKRMIQFADQTGLTIELVYYPPYHSKYNSVERCWGILEQHWNGAILDSLDTVLAWTRSMTWKGVSPLVRFLDKTYEKGVRLSKKAFRSFSDRLKRSKLLPKWSVTIGPLVAEPS